MTYARQFTRPLLQLTEHNAQAFIEILAQAAEADAHLQAALLDALYAFQVVAKIPDDCAFPIAQ